MPCYKNISGVVKTLSFQREWDEAAQALTGPFHNVEVPDGSIFTYYVDPYNAFAGLFADFVEAPDPCHNNH